MPNYDELFQSDQKFEQVSPVVKPSPQAGGQSNQAEQIQDGGPPEQSSVFAAQESDKPIVSEPAQRLELPEDYTDSGDGTEAEYDSDAQVRKLKFEKDRAERITGGGGPVPMPNTRVTSEKMVRVEIHKELYDVIKSFVVGGGNKQEVMEAFICAWAAGYVPVPDGVRDLIPHVKVPEDKAGEGIDNLLGMMRNMRNRMTQQDSDLAILKTCMTWLIAERSGCNVNHTSQPEKMDFMFPEHDAIQRQLFSQVTQHEEARKRHVGRVTGDRVAKYRNGGK